MSVVVGPVALTGRAGTATSGPTWRTGAALEGVSEDIGAARRLATDFLARVGAQQGTPVPGDVIVSVQLVVSELVTNACRHAPGPCLLDLETDGKKSIRISVRDTSPARPTAPAADPRRVGQHGLEIVNAVCGGFDVQSEPEGKRVTARVALDPTPG